MKEISRLQLYNWILNETDRMHEDHMSVQFFEYLSGMKSFSDLLHFNIIMLTGIEEAFLKGNLKDSDMSKDEYYERLNINLKKTENSDYSEFINDYLRTLPENLLERRNVYYCFNELLNELNKINNRHLGKLKLRFEGYYDTYKDTLNRYNKVFLSYAFDDFLYSLCLHAYLLSKGIFLYVDGIFSPKKEDGILLKENLCRELKTSKQLLFLRTTNTEFNIRGSGNIRGWCSWELGTFYTADGTNHCNKFYIELYKGRNSKISNLQLHGITPLREIQGGILKGDV